MVTNVVTAQLIQFRVSYNGRHFKSQTHLKSEQKELGMPAFMG